MEKKNIDPKVDPNFQVGAGFIVIFCLIVGFYALGVVTAKYWH